MNLLDEDWTTWSPRPNLAPRFERVQEGDDTMLRIDGNSNASCVGCWFKIVQVMPRKTYKFSVKFRVSNITDPIIHVTNLLVYVKDNVTDDNSFTNFIEAYTKDGAFFVGEQSFATPPFIDRAKIQLQFKFSGTGSVEWTDVQLEETSDMHERNVVIAAFHGAPPAPSTPEQARSFWADQIDAAMNMKQRPDLVLLPEAINTASMPVPVIEDLAEPIPGPTFEMLARKAKEHGTYISTTIYEQDDGLVYNTAVLIDRDGMLAGKYRKTHLYYPEIVNGVTPGDDFPVFTTDFGTVGIIVCYDSWFVEPCRLIALGGAEIILFPNAGYDERVLVARAIDNDVYIAVASLGNPAMLIHPTGFVLEKHEIGPGFASSEMDLNDRSSPHPNAGGNMMSSGAGKLGKRNARSFKVFDEINKKIHD